MHVNHYSRALLDNAIDLLNRPPSGVPDVVARWTAIGMPLENRAAGSDIDTIRDYCIDWARMVDASDEPGRVAVLNLLLRRWTSPPIVTDHDHSGWHLHHRPAEASLGEIIAASTTVAVAEHLTAYGMQRLGRCALPECGNAYVDHSRPGRQRYCSQACANRDAVRRHRGARKS